MYCFIDVTRLRAGNICVMSNCVNMATGYRDELKYKTSTIAIIEENAVPAKSENYPRIAKYSAASN